MTDNNYFEQKTMELKEDDIAYVVSSQYDQAIISQIRIKGRCEEGPGYTGTWTQPNRTFWKFESGDDDMHTCSMYLVSRLKDARKVAKEMNRIGLEKMKAEQSNLSARIDYAQHYFKYPKRLRIDGHNNGK